MSEATVAEALDYAIEKQRQIEAVLKFVLKSVVEDRAAGRIDHATELGATVVLTRCLGVNMARGLKRLREFDRATPFQSDKDQIRDVLKRMREMIEAEVAR